MNYSKLSGLSLKYHRTISHHVHHNHPYHLQIHQICTFPSLNITSQKFQHLTLCFYDANAFFHLHILHHTQAAQYLALKVFHIYDDSGKRLHIDKLLQQDPKIWPTSLSNKLDRLIQGVRTIEGNNAMVFIPHSAVPAHKKVAYAKMICDFALIN